MICDKMKLDQEEIMSSLMKMGHTADEIRDMLREYRDSQNLIPAFIVTAIREDDAQTILDWLGSPVDGGKLNIRHDRWILNAAPNCDEWA